MTSTRPHSPRYRLGALSLSGSELEELDGFLAANADYSCIAAADALHGFLTAVALTPADIAPSAWLPHVWNDSLDDTPAFESPSQEKRLNAYALRMFEGIMEELAEADGQFAPLVAQIETASGQAYSDAEGWCQGFVQGILLLHEHWDAFLASSAGRCLVLPIFLLGAEASPADWRVLTATPRQRAKLTEWVAVAVEAIGTQLFMLESAGRDPCPDDSAAARQCPCRSGKSFKSCCGAPNRLH